MGCGCNQPKSPNAGKTSHELARKQWRVTASDGSTLDFVDYEEARRYARRVAGAVNNL